jgi:hypothetical protein
MYSTGVHLAIPINEKVSKICTNWPSAEDTTPSSAVKEHILWPTMAKKKSTVHAPMDLG